jgi:hypothetical protein
MYLLNVLQSPSHTLGSDGKELIYVLEDLLLESPSHPVGLELDGFLPCSVGFLVVSIPHGRLGTMLSFARLSVAKMGSPSHPVGLERVCD